MSTQYGKQIKEIETQNLLMKPLSFQDLNAMYALTSDEEVAKYMRFETHQSIETTETLIKEYIEWDTYHSLSIIEKSSDKFVGVFVFKQDEKEETNYSLTTFNGKEFWNKGYSTEILEAMKPYAKEYLGAQTLSAYVMSENKGSCKVLEKNGFKVKETLHFEGAPCPLFIYQVNL